ncbi:MFS transporter [Streptomyces lichenis]|uniref:MFS transporter n=1 Tax=Streptomyces lichenis TaxID=2306967 RepID=A0ABT0IDC3_9ACTN|nr:MFS transporter [Streptomyces lichenis]MCK8679323.1 MFS transporter [Streptomyces lichenis]
MAAGRRLGRGFGWLWAAYAASTFGTWVAFDAFALVAILVLHAGPAEVSLLAAAGPAVGALAAVPFGPWVEFRRKRPVMVAMDLLRCAALLSVPAAYALDRLGLVQLLVVAVVVGAADIAFTAAAGACLKALVRPDDLVVASGRLESTTWTATLLGPPLGGALTGLLGPVAVVLANAAGYLLSALGVRTIGGAEPRPARPVRPPGSAVVRRSAEVSAGWRYILADPVLRPLFVHTVLVNALILAVSPVLAVLMLGELGFAPWQYGLAFALPCAGGLIGSRLAGRLVDRFGARRVLRTAGTLRVCWPLALAFTGPGTGGLVLVLLVQSGMLLCIGVFNPVYAALRLRRVPADRTARTLAAWSVTGKAAVAALTALWGLLAGLTGPRPAIAAAGLLLLATPLLLPTATAPDDHPEPARS